MSISLYTALTIQNSDNDIRCEPYSQCKTTGHWAGAINLYHDGCFHTTLLSSEQVHQSEELAIATMKNLLEQISTTDL